MASHDKGGHEDVDEEKEQVDECDEDDVVVRNNYHPHNHHH